MCPDLLFEEETEQCADYVSDCSSTTTQDMYSGHMLTVTLEELIFLVSMTDDTYGYYLS